MRAKYGYRDVSEAISVARERNNEKLLDKAVREFDKEQEKEYRRTLNEADLKFALAEEL